MRGKPIEVALAYRKCSQCGDEVIDPESDVDPFDLAYGEYRRQHGLLQPEEIRAWRESCSLTQGELARLLGLGIATVNRYENGTLQSEFNDKMIRLAMEPSNLLKLVEASEGLFTEQKKKRLLEVLRETDAASHSLDSSIMVNFGSYEPSEFNGYMKLSLSKLYNAILFLAKGGVLKSKLNKLLFYADFSYFREFAVSITGLKYVHLPYGPVPDNYEMYYASLFSRGAVEFLEETYPNGYVGEIIRSVSEPDLSRFTTSELRVLASVKERFQAWNAKQIADFSHTEPAYQQTRNAEIITYMYANQLSF